MTLPGSKKLVCVGSYRLTGHRLGRGNFARVEEALHTVLKTKVALKVMNVADIKEEYVVRNLHREAKLMSRLSHPCIASLYETIQCGSIYYLVTELVPGGDLCNFIKTQPGCKLDEKTTKIFGRQLVSAVAYMHGMGIVHRDLKLENIMLNDVKNQIKIVDFGLSNTWSPESPLHTHCGSPEYAAPELFISGRLYGPQVDLWSLGVIFYGMVLGELPFVSSRDTHISSQERRKYLLSQINRGLAPIHRKALAHFSIEFRAMIVRLLIPDPSKRIRVLELIRHPWLTERNRKPLRISGFKELDAAWKNVLLQQIAEMVGLELSLTEMAIQNEPYGMIAGMYNILAFRQKLHTSESAKNSSTLRRPSTSSNSTQQNIRRYNIGRPITAFSPNVKQREGTGWVKDEQTVPSKLRVVGSRNTTKSNKNSIKTNHSSPIKNQETTIINRRTKSEPLQQTSRPSTVPSECKAKAKSKQPQKRSASIQPKDSRNPELHKKCVRIPDSTTTITRTRPVTSITESATTNKHVPTCHIVTRNKPVLSDPIARCIAGYMGKYMNEQTSKLRWIKDFAAFNNPSKMVTHNKYLS